MLIAQDSVVSIHYTLKNDAGEVLDSSDGTEPLVYLHGNGNLVPGLEEALAGKQRGEHVAVRVAPENAYGERDLSLIQEVPRSAFRDIQAIEVGMQFQAESNHGPRTVTVVQLSDTTVTVDGNHPLAGENLNFTVEIADVRAATEEEL